MTYPRSFCVEPSGHLPDAFLDACVRNLRIRVDFNEAKHRGSFLGQHIGGPTPGVQCQAFHLREQVRGHVLPHQLQCDGIAGASVGSRLEVKHAMIGGIGNVEMGGDTKRVRRERCRTRYC